MKKYILIAAAAFSMAACNNDDNIVDEPVAVQVSATIGQGAVSRASNSQWSEADAIGIAMGSRYINMKYVTENGDGIFAGTTMYFRNKREPVTLTAYYPFSGKEGEVPDVISASTTADIQTTDEQPKFDFLFAKVENVTGADPNVEFAFDHKMSKLTFIFKNGNDGTDVRKINTYTLDELVLEGTFNPATGSCSVKSDVDAETLTMDVTGRVVDNEAVPSLILFPQELETLTLTITDSDNQSYQCSLPIPKREDFKGLEGGNNYQFTVIVSKTKLTVNPSIIDWETIPTDEGKEPVASSSDD